jgi:hypothetical protein
LLDVDDDVISWACQPVALSVVGGDYRPDFFVRRQLSDAIIDSVSPTNILEVAAAVAIEAGCRYEVIDQKSLSPIRLKNAKDLLRYGGYETPLSDRIRLLAALEENGNLTVAECLPAFLDIKPIAGLASLVLHRFVTMDLDEIIGPETQVSRIHS